MAYASPSTINGSKGITEVLTYINTVTGNWISRMLILGIWVVFLMGYVKSQREDDYIGGFAVASFVTFVLGSLLWIIGFLDNATMGTVLGATVISVLVLYLSKRD